jgi:hypothetical protein
MSYNLFTPNYNTTAVCWDNMPWVAGATIVASDVLCQQLRPALPVNRDSQGVIVGGSAHYLHRLILGPQIGQRIDWDGPYLVLNPRYLVLGNDNGLIHCLQIQSCIRFWNGNSIAWSNCVALGIFNG